MRYRRGLVVGKFAPLHRGHERLVAAAREACDEVVIVSYANPERPGCDPARREAWLAARFPFARRIVLATGPHDDEPGDTHRRFVGDVLRREGAAPVDAVFTSESYGPGFAAVLGEILGIPVAHVAVDPDRRIVPISGTAIRADVHAHREHLAPEVYASFVTRVALVGGESTGKSTLAAALAERLGTGWVHEYGRELWEARGGTLDPPDLLHIAEEQVRREEVAALTAHRFLFCDTTPLVTLFYAEWLFGEATPALHALARRRYDVTILCAADIPFDQDGQRQDEAFRDRQQAYYLEHLAREGVVPSLVSGDLDSRIAGALALLDPS
ncbi:MAG TPA: AAA family ATPase [Kofleriaceae bacterium]|nr:AAA family ATPase [Kofleriaceae bacterium]